MLRRRAGKVETWSTSVSASLNTTGSWWNLEASRVCLPVSAPQKGRVSHRRGVSGGAAKKCVAQSPLGRRPSI